MTTVHEIAVGCETVTAVIDLTNPYNEARRAPYERTGMTENTTASDAADLTPEIECDCLVAWNRSEFGANQHDTVHPMYLTAFKSGYKAALAASAPAPQPAAPQGDGVPTWQAAQDPMLECSIQPRPLSHPLAAYHSAMSKGPLHYTWQDKPHRLVYDLIAAVKHYANQAGQADPIPGAGKMLGDLLARIHGDGGHYASEHGIEKAVADADRILAEWRAYKPAPLQQGEYLPLPAPAHRGPCGTGSYFDAYVDADRAARATADSVLEDAARLDWLEQHDGRYYNLDKVAAIVGTGFLVQSEGNMPQVHSTLREAIDDARKQGANHD